MSATARKYRLREFQVDNSADVELFNLMQYHPSVMRAKGYYKSGFDYKNEVDLKEYDNFWRKSSATLEKGSKDVFFAIADKLNRVVGWIWFFKDLRNPLPARVAKDLGVTSRNSCVFQISYEKLMSRGWPVSLVEKIEHVTLGYLKKERKGVVVEGLRLAIGRLKRAMKRVYITPRKLVLYAYVHQSNIGSKKVLQYNGFKRVARKYSYEGTPHYVWVKVV